ncbi:MAG: hypothetical protein OEZ01_10420, partial [Candidatus Heimdallarchaeota archaeon]|nr:hypothetical protein [Candidatus Heimdallarchaeota archaeon]
MYALWTVSDILNNNYAAKYLSLGEDIKRASLKYFADNFNDFISRQINPQDPMGVENPATIQSRIDRFFDENPASVTKIVPEGYYFDEELKRDVSTDTNQIRTDGYGLDIFPIESASVSDFILQLLPLDSGLRGPVGGIVDALLKLLFDELGGALGLSGDTVDQIVQSFLQIPDFIGAISDGDSTRIKEFINNILPMLPIPQDLTKYIDLLIDGLFLLRGSQTDITNFISNAIVTITPNVTLGSFQLSDILNGLFTLGSSVFDKINNGGNIMDIIVNVFNEVIISNLTQSVFSNSTIFGLTPSEILSLGSKITTTIGMVINLINTQSIVGLVQEYGPTLLNVVFSELGISTVNSEIIMLGVSAILTAAGVIQDTTIEDVLIELVSKISTASNNTIVEQIGKVVQAIGNATESEITDIASFKNNVIDPLLNALDLNADFENAIKDIATLAVAISNAELNLDNTTTIVTLTANLLKGVGVLNNQHVDVISKVINYIGYIVNYIEHPTNFLNLLGLETDAPQNLQEAIPKLIKTIGNFVKSNLINDSSSEANDIINHISEGVALIVQLISEFQGNSLKGILLTLLQGATYTISQFTDINITAYVELAKAVFGQIVGLFDTPPTLEETLAIVSSLVPESILPASDLNTIVSLVLTLRDVFTNGFSTIFAQLTEWLIGLATDLITSLSSEIGGLLGNAATTLFEINLPLSIGPFSLFTIELSLGISPGFEFNTEKFSQMIVDLVFKGTTVFNGNMSPFEVFKEILSFFSIVPEFEARLEIKDFGSGENSFLSFMLESLGVQLSFSGYGFFKLLLFKFQNGSFNFDNFFNVIEWGFGFTITISRTFTLLDFITGGAGGSLNAIGAYIGLDAISITIAFTLGLDVVKRAATANQPETGSLTITVGISFTVSLGIDIVIARLVLTGTLAIVLTLLQDLVAPAPLRVFISIQLIITVTIGFLFWDWNFDFRWSPDGYEPPLGKELTASSPEQAVQEGAIGGDTDGDGLSDEYERSVPGLNIYSVDSDGDQLSDKFETQTLGTSPTSWDTDQDGLGDFQEYTLKTDPLKPDTDFDTLNDYEELVILGTSPFSMDTDQDGLDDSYEVNHSWNMTGITASVSNINIGGSYYNDRTDPLNPDTDGDGLLDGEEGPRGIYYGPELYSTDPGMYGYVPDDPLIF